MDRGSVFSGHPILGLILLKLKQASNRPVYFRETFPAYREILKISSRITFQPQARKFTTQHDIIIHKGRKYHRILFQRKIY